MKTTREVPCWFIVDYFGRTIEGPFFIQTTAMMRLVSFPGGRVEPRMRKDPEFVEEVEPSE